MSELRALSIREPWLHAIVHGDKRVENRSWPAPAWVIGTTIALHASKSFDWEAQFPYGKSRMWAPPEDVPLGAITAVATVAGCHHSEDCMMPTVAVPACGRTGCSPWAARGQYHWELSGAHALAEPVPCKGSLGLWKLPEDVEKAVREQLEAPHA